MEEIIRWITSEDVSFYTRVWRNETLPPKAIIFLVHGSVEHGGRYKAFAEHLTQQGYVVVAPDLRGHGETGIHGDGLGYFSDAPMGWEICVHDLKVIYDQCVDWYPGLPLIVFGHSMGSYLVRCFIKEYPVAMQGVVLSGTGHFATGIGDLALGLSKVLMHTKGKRYKSRFLTSLVYGTLNKRIGKTETDFDFLSRDTEQVRRYIEDPLCGYICTVDYLHEMLFGTKKANRAAMFELANRQLPLLLISGGEDPVADRGGKGFKKVFDSYKHRMDDVTAHVYEGARHEVLNETNRETVMADICAWLKTIEKYK
ncbi:MAG: lysophospholipase [Clostridia bacterium]|nr:lysophospholipase [Clostridia bacterium]